MASSTPNIVLLEINGGERPVYEKKASAAVKPGEALAEAATTVAPNGTAGADILVAVALENPFAPDPTVAALAQSYATGDTVRFIYPDRADKVYMWLKSGQNVAYGAKLELATAGQLQAISTGKFYAVADEAVNASAGAKQIRVRIA